MEITNIKDMIKVRNQLLTQLQTEEKSLKKTNLKEQAKIQERIDQINKGLYGIEQIMVKGASFKSKDFAIFMTKFLILTEGNYRLAEVTLPDELSQEEGLINYLKRKRAKRKGKRLDYKKGTKCYFISDEITQEFILKNIYDLEDLDDFIWSSRSDDVTIFDTYYVYPFHENMKMKEEFAKHPRLKTAIYELIQLKLDNPKATDQERFETVLTNTVARNLRRSQNAYQKKRESIH